MDSQKSEIREINAKLLAYRNNGEFDKAIDLCKETIQKFPDNDFYPMIAGDLYFFLDDYDSTIKYYIEFLSKMPDSRHLFGEFAKRYYKLKRTIPHDQLVDYTLQIYNELAEGLINEQNKTRCMNLIMHELESVELLSEEVSQIEQLLKSDKNFFEATNKLKELETKNPFKLELILDKQILNRSRDKSTYRIDSFCISIYEKVGRLNKALKLSEELLFIKLDAIVVRSFFRICRKIGNYDKVDFILSKHPFILKMWDFNVLYELVYYFEYLDDFDRVQSILQRIERGGSDSISIQKTVKNFYLRFGLLDDANRVSLYIAELQSKRGVLDEKFSEVLHESEAEVGSKIKELYSELEHQQQLAAICDLTSGISHELGQPITNIRYTIQYHRKLIEKIDDKNEIFEIFDSILEETKRMGALVSRLSPMTSSKSIDENFDIIERIKLRFNAESSRLKQKNILAKITSTEPVNFFGDPSKFDQIISNLLINSIDSFRYKKKYGINRININVADQKSDIKITITDTGMGIPLKNRGKIYDPFFTTKPPGRGQGLGLFIVWNIIKYFGGEIKLDPRYRNGARFNIILPKETNKNEE